MLFKVRSLFRKPGIETISKPSELATSMSVQINKDLTKEEVFSNLLLDEKSKKFILQTRYC